MVSPLRHLQRSIRPPSYTACERIPRRLERVSPVGIVQHELPYWHRVWRVCKGEELAYQLLKWWKTCIFCTKRKESKVLTWELWNPGRRRKYHVDRGYSNHLGSDRQDTHRSLPCRRKHGDGSRNIENPQEQRTECERFENRASSTEEGERKGEVKLVAPNWLYPMLGIAARHAVPFAFAGFTPRTRHCSPERASALPLSSFHSTKVLWSFGVCALEAINEEHDSRDFQRTRVKSLL